MLYDHHRESILLDLVRDLYEDAKGYVIKYGYLRKIKDDTRLLVVHNEAQFLGDAFNGSFQSMSSSDESSRSLLFPIVHAFRDIDEYQLMREKIDGFCWKQSIHTHVACCMHWFCDRCLLVL